MLSMEDCQKSLFMWTQPVRRTQECHSVKLKQNYTEPLYVEAQIIPILYMFCSLSSRVPIILELTVFHLTWIEFNGSEQNECTPTF